MKTLIVYQSRDGHTRKIAEQLATTLNADLEEIKEIKSRKGVIGWLSAGRDGTLQKATPIEPTRYNPADYDLVIIGTPIWAFTVTGGVRSWLKQNGSVLTKVVFFATMGGSGDKRAFTHMQELCLVEPKLTATFIDKKIDKNEHQEELQKFIAAIQALING
jgi:flavodoxin